MPASELQNLPDHTFYFQTLLNGRPHDPVHVRAFSPFSKDTIRRLWRDKGRTSGKDRVLQQSLERYGRDRRVVEAELNHFLTVA